MNPGSKNMCSQLMARAVGAQTQQPPPELGHIAGQPFGLGRQGLEEVSKGGVRLHLQVPRKYAVNHRTAFDGSSPLHRNRAH